jgi:hypothetical protein
MENVSVIFVMAMSVPCSHPRPALKPLYFIRIYCNKFKVLVERSLSGGTVENGNTVMRRLSASNLQEIHTLTHAHPSICMIARG